MSTSAEKQKEIVRLLPYQVKSLDCPKCGQLMLRDRFFYCHHCKIEIREVWVLQD